MKTNLTVYLLTLSAGFAMKLCQKDRLFRGWRTSPSASYLENKDSVAGGRPRLPAILNKSGESKLSNTIMAVL